MTEIDISEDNEELDGYKVDLPDFRGPLDLLLSLIEQEELDITKISLAHVTDQYLSHLDILKETDADELTAFLVIAAKLILIKSEVLLPRPPPILVEEDQEDVGDELARQLMLYKRFKEIALQLRAVEDKQQRNFVRIIPHVKIEPKLVAGSGDIEDLLKAARNALAIKAEDPDVDEVISPEVVTIGQQMAHIRQVLSTGQSITFSTLLQHTHNRIEVIVTLLAILELIKRNVVSVEQTAHFNDITINKRENTTELSETEWTELAGLTDVS